MTTDLSWTDLLAILAILAFSAFGLWVTNRK